MDEVRILEIKQSVFANNDQRAELLRRELKEKRIFLLNLMSSPGSGKTTTLTRTIERLRDEFKIGVMEADIDSDVDARTIAATGVKSIQLHTGGMCHLVADMTRQGLEGLDQPPGGVLVPAPNLQQDAVHLVCRLLSLLEKQFKLSQILVRPQDGLLFGLGPLLQRPFQGLHRGLRLPTLIISLVPGLLGPVQLSLHLGYRLGSGLLLGLSNGVLIHNGLHGHIHRLFLEHTQLFLQRSRPAAS